MASLVKLRRIINPLTAKNTGLLYNAVRSKTYTHDDWKPGPYPKTEAERKKAAEKYGLSVEEYEPYPDDGDGLGDYPKLPLIGKAARDPYYPWDDPTQRKNFNEPWHKFENIMGEDRWDAGVKERVSAKVGIGGFLGVMGAFGCLVWWGEYYPSFPAVMEKQLPKPGDVHYTFEPAR